MAFEAGLKAAMERMDLDKNSSSTSDPVVTPAASSPATVFG